MFILMPSTKGSQMFFSAEQKASGAENRHRHNFIHLDQRVVHKDSQ